MRHWNVCPAPLRCGWKGGQRSVSYYSKSTSIASSELLFITTRYVTWFHDNDHMSQCTLNHGGDGIKLVKMEANEYKWDHKAGLLRVICKNTGMPKPAGWLRDSRESMVQPELTNSDVGMERTVKKRRKENHNNKDY